MANAEAWFNKSLRPRKPESSLGRTAQDGHLDSHTAPELRESVILLSLKLTVIPILLLPEPGLPCTDREHERGVFAAGTLTQKCQRCEVRVPPPVAATSLHPFTVLVLS